MIRLSLIWTLCLFLAPILVVQGLLTRRRAIKLPEAIGVRSSQHVAPNILVLGDSVVAGVGVETTSQALPAKLARSMATLVGNDIAWRAVGFNGDKLQDVLANLKQQIVLGAEADLVIVNVGVNDASGLTSMTRWQMQLVALIAEVKQHFDCPLTFIGLPPVGFFPLLPHPLRFVLGVRAQMLDLSMAKIASVMPNVFYVPLELPLQAEYMAEDGYHPSAQAIELIAHEMAQRLQKEGALGRLISPRNV